MNKQLPINILKIIGKSVSPCVCAHYHKAGARDILEPHQILHFGITVIKDG